MEKAGDVMMHPLWCIPVGLLLTTTTIQAMHTATHWHMQIDADAYCLNNAEWVESNTQSYDEDDY